MKTWTGFRLSGARAMWRGGMAAAFALVVSGSTLLAQGIRGTTFGPSFVPGQVMVYELEATVEGSETFGADQFPNSHNTDIVFRVVVRNVAEDGSAQMLVRWDRVAMNGNTLFGGEWRFDSDDPAASDNPQIATALNRLKSATAFVDVAPDGQVQRIRGLEHIVQSMQGLAQLRSRAGEYTFEGFSQLLESLWMVGDAVETKHLGEQWTNVQEVDSPGLGTWTFTSRFDFIGADADLVAVNLVVDMELDAPTQTLEESLREMGVISGDSQEAEGEEGDALDDVSPGMMSGGESTAAAANEAGAASSAAAGQEGAASTGQEGNMVEMQAEPEAEAWEPPPPIRVDFAAFDNQGRIVWDRGNNLLLTKTSGLSFFLEVESVALFGDDPTVTSMRQQAAKSTLRRLELTIPGRTDAGVPGTFANDDHGHNHEGGEHNHGPN